MNILSKISLCFTIYLLLNLSILYGNDGCVTEEIIAKYPKNNWQYQCLEDNLVLVIRTSPFNTTHVVDVSSRIVFTPGDYNGRNIRLWNDGNLLSFTEYESKLFFYNAEGEKKYIYVYVNEFTNKKAIVFNETTIYNDTKEKVVVVNTEGKIISPNYDFLSPISEGLAVVANDGVFGYLNEHLEMVIPLQFDLAQPFSNGLASVRKNGKYGFINQTGQVIIPFIYDDSYTAFSNGLTAVKKQEKWGLIDIAGDIIAPFIYDDIWAFSEGLAIVKRAGKRGFINTHGKEIIPVKFDDAISFYHGVARVKTNEKWEFINKEGKNIN